MSSYKIKEVRDTINELTVCGECNYKDCDMCENVIDYVKVIEMLEEYMALKVQFNQ
ncbi:MAG: hypothetical protein ACRC1P_09685 [Cellulosilyticaceae bacterium]